MVFRYFLLASCIFTAQGLIGVELMGSAANCSVSLQRSSKHEISDEIQWIKLEGNYFVPCFDTIHKPNTGKFSIVTRTDHSVYLAFIVLETHGSYSLKVTYLDPETRLFESLKKLGDKPDCFTEPMEISPQLNFATNGWGKIEYGPPSMKCNVSFKEENFFDKTIHELDVDAADQEIRQKRSNSSSYHDSRVLSSTEPPVPEPTFIKMGVFGNITISKMENNSASATNITYKLEGPYSTTNRYVTWPNFVYIFDETSFVKPFFFVNGDNKVDEVSSSFPISFPIFYQLIFLGFFHVMLLVLKT